MTREELVNHLEELGACEGALDWVAATQGEPEHLWEKANGANLDWLCVRLGLREAYKAQVAPLREAYRAQVAPLREAYNTQGATLREAYGAQVAPLREAHKAQVAALWEAHKAQVATLWEAHKAQVAPLWEAYAVKLGAVIRSAVTWARVAEALTS